MSKHKADLTPQMQAELDRTRPHTDGRHIDRRDARVTPFARRPQRSALAATLREQMRTGR